MVIVVIVQLLSCVRLFVAPWTVVCQAPLSSISCSLLKFMSIVSDAIYSSHLFHPLLLLPSVLPSIRVFFNDSAVQSGGQSTGASATASVLPMNIQNWFPLGWTGWISLQSRRLLKVFSNTTVQKHQFFGAKNCTILGKFDHSGQSNVSAFQYAV